MSTDFSASTPSVVTASKPTPTASETSPSGVNRARLEQAFARLSNFPRRHADLDVLFLNLIVDHSDDELIRINARKLANRWDKPVDNVLNWFLFSSRVELFELNWESHCPHCKGLVGSESHAGRLAASGQCKMCLSSYEVHADDNVEITFSLSQSIRRTTPSLTSFVPQNVEVLTAYDVVYPLTVTFEKAGKYSIVDVQSGRPTAITHFDVDPIFLPKSAVSITFYPESVEPRLTQLAPGKVDLDIQGTPKVLLTSLSIDEKIPAKSIVTGLDLMLLPAFKEIFAAETLSQRESLSVRNLTVMFTDITGSTAMYQRLGDARAYNLVRDHFDVLFKEIDDHQGIVTKTIGDAVMAVFHDPEHALNAALHMQQSIRKFNENRTLDQGIVLVKIGIHTGSAIAVNLNNTLDYFGNMVNMAARIQSKSRSEEILMSSETYQDANVQKLIQSDSALVISESVFDLHGIGEKRLVSVINKL